MLVSTESLVEKEFTGFFFLWFRVCLFCGFCSSLFEFAGLEFFELGREYSFVGVLALDSFEELAAEKVYALSNILVVLHW